RHGTGHLRGAEGPEPGDAALLRGHGARSARERPASRLPAAPRLAHGLPAGAPRPRRAGRRVRVGRVVLRLQAAPQARRSPSPAPHGRGPPQALAPGQLDFARSTQRSPRRIAAQLGAALGALVALARLVLKRGADARLRAGHPWIYRTQVADLRGFSRAGDTVDVLDAGGRFVGRGFYNPRPSLCCRLLTRQDEAIDAGFFQRRL